MYDNNNNYLEIAHKMFYINNIMTNYSENSLLNIGRLLRFQRKDIGLNQQDLARKVGVRRQTIADLEKGKNVGSRLLCSVIDALNVRLFLEPQDTSAGEALELNKHGEKAEPIQSSSVDFDYPYDWSNPGNMPDDIFIAKVLRGQRFVDIVKLCKKYGIERIEKQIVLSSYDDIRPKLANAMKNIRRAISA